jgi:hypothetical protein
MKNISKKLRSINNISNTKVRLERLEMFFTKLNIEDIEDKLYFRKIINQIKTEILSLVD